MKPNDLIITCPMHRHVGLKFCLEALDSHPYPSSHALNHRATGRSPRQHILVNGVQTALEYPIIPESPENLEDSESWIP